MPNFDVLPKKKVKLELVGLDGNAFSLMGQFERQARREKWTPEEIKAVRDECMAGDYDDLLCVLMSVCESPEKEEDLEDDEDFEEGDEEDDEED